MRDNLEELNQRGLADIPVLLGGAALTRSYVERDLRGVYEGRLFYGKDAFEGLRVMDRLGEHPPGRRRRPRPGVGSRASRRVRRASPPRAAGDGDGQSPSTLPARSPEVETDNPVFVPPFLGSKVVKGIAIDDIAGYLNETALFRNQWQFRPESRADGTMESDDEFKDRIRPILRDQLAEAKASRPAGARRWSTATSRPTATATTWSSGRTRPAPSEWLRFGYPRQSKAPWLCIADFFRPVGSADADYAAFHIVTMGQRCRAT